MDSERRHPSPIDGDVGDNTARRSDHTQDAGRRAEQPRVIGEVLLICLECGRVKGDHDEWRYERQDCHSDSTLLSHGYCPGCFDEILAAWASERREVRSFASDDVLYPRGE